MASPGILQFEPFNSAVESTFWHALTRNKIDLYRLDDTPKDITGYYTTGQSAAGAGGASAGDAASPSGASEALPARLCVGTGAFGGSLPPFVFAAPGTLKNTNTIEEFKDIDKTLLFKQTADQIWRDIQSGAALKQPHLLNRFILLTFADLKKYKFYYWFGFPALLPPESVKVRNTRPVGDVLNADEIQSLRENYEKLRNIPEDASIQSPGTGFFLARKTTEGTVKVAHLAEWDTFVDGIPRDEIIVGFADPSGLAGHPGWPLRNLLVLLKKHSAMTSFKIICYRETPRTKDILRSIVLEVEVPGEFGEECPKTVGWEKNTAGKLGPRLADLAPLMDPARLADTAVDLNLKLMRWRIMPSLQLEKIGATKCLLLGSGTLGCYVARALMGWGIRHITFVDNGRVSFSNPVRQPLFTFDDCLEGGKPKAIAAAEALKRIFPGANATGHILNIPMPGHTVDSPEKTRADVDALRALIESHDAVFLLTDSRESRWLPTVIGASLGKIVINSALGFDTFLVMRHGMRVDPPAGVAKSPLGCYFCNDVVAPADSLSDRTLDQQCTVTRPGLSAIASASAVELLVSVINHTDGPFAPADTTREPSEPTSMPLGLVPHQIRGFLTHFTNLLVVGQAYDKCTACSDIILSEYRTHGFDFLLRAFNSPQYLEEITGLQDMHRESEAVDVDWEEEEEGEDGW
ncbi:Autophagy protein 7 [Borealophlyctis nickersoniae]|nr:Autophagy protein 7 [Borealophlyctis nickersoniae]